MRKICALLLILAVFLYSVGCGPAEDRGPEIVIWHWMSDRHQVFLELAHQYYEKEGVPVSFRLFPHSAYTQRIDAAAAANDLPDLFGILGEKRVLASFAKEGMIENLSPYMEKQDNKWKNRFIEIALKVNSFENNNIYQVEPGIYGVPIDTMSIQFLYNENLLEKAGFNPNTPPNNLQSFITAAKAANNIPGVYGFTSGWGETWMLECLVTNYAFNVMGKDKFIRTIKGDVPYTDSDWVKVFSVFKELREADILAPDIVTMNNKEAEEMFATERAIFTFNGSWGVNTYRQINPNLSYAAMPPPPANSKHKPGIWAGAGSSFVLNAKSHMKKEAIAFLKWLTDEERQEFLTRKTENLPAIKGLGDSVEGSLKVFSQNQELFTHPRLWPVTENSRVIEAINRGIQNIIIGARTPKEVAEEVNRVKQRFID